MYTRISTEQGHLGFVLSIYSEGKVVPIFHSYGKNGCG